MIELKQNNTKVNLPSGFEVLTFKKERSATYHGFMQRSTALNEQGSITFKEPKAILLLRSEFEKKGNSENFQEQ